MSAEVDALGLVEWAKSAAEKLKKDHPAVVFTSGLRSVAEQAKAMASNIVYNRNWIKETYAASEESKALQKWVDDHPEAVDAASIAAGLEAEMKDWNETKLVRLSRHFSGLAFDVSPSSGNEVKKAIANLSYLVKFLEKEGGLTIWHAEFKKK